MIVEHRVILTMQDETFKAINSVKSNLDITYRELYQRAITYWLNEKGYLEYRKFTTDEIIKFLHYILQHRQWSRHKLENAIDLSSGELYKILDGTNNPQLKTVEKIEKWIRKEYGCKDCKKLPVDNNWSGWWKPENQEKRSNICNDCFKKSMEI